VPSVSYDVVVCGDDLSSVVTAALCAKRGLRTLLLTPDGATAHYQLGASKLCTDPVVWPKSSAALERVMKELRIDLTSKRKFRELPLAAHVVGAHFRIALGESLHREMARELGETTADVLAAAIAASSPAAKSLDMLIADEHGFPGGGFFERRETNKWVSNTERESLGFSAFLQKGVLTATPWINALFALWNRHPTVGGANSARALDALSAGLVPLRGSADAMRELFLERLATSGGEVRVGRVAEMSISWGKVTSLTLASGDQIGCGQCLFGLPAAELQIALGKKSTRRIDELAEQSNIVGYRYTLNVVIDETGLPEGMAPIVFVLPQAAPAGKDPSEAAADDPGFCMQVSEPDDKGRVILTVSTTVPSDAPLSAEDQREEAARLRRRIWQRMEDIMPFFERHVVVSHSPHDGWAPVSVAGSKVAGNTLEAPRGMPVAMRPVWQTTLEDSCSLAAMPYATGIKNLSFCGDQILPGLGLEGDFAAAWTVTKIACSIAGKKKDYLHNEVVGAPDK
jgi:phytoene dehydrogenase-like protein